MNKIKHHVMLSMEVIFMDNKLLTQLRILKLTDSKPNFSELSRQYGIDRHTIKNYYNGYTPISYIDGACKFSRVNYLLNYIDMSHVMMGLILREIGAKAPCKWDYRSEIYSFTSLSYNLGIFILVNTAIP